MRDARSTLLLVSLVMAVSPACKRPALAPESRPREDVALRGKAPTAVSSSPAPSPPGLFEVVRVNDASEALGSLSHDRLTSMPAGFSLFRERVPFGPDRWVTPTVIWARAETGETFPAVSRRLWAWLATVPLPPGDRFGVQDETEPDEMTGKRTFVGVRSLVLTGEPFLRADDLTAAVAEQDSIGASLALTLSEPASERFAAVTSEMVLRRIAIIVEDRVVSAPRVLSSITGTHLTIAMDQGSPAEQLAEARRLAGRLAPPR